METISSCLKAGMSGIAHLVRKIESQQSFVERMHEFSGMVIDRYAVCKLGFSNWWIIELIKLVKLVEHELWQQEQKGLIGILPVQDAAEAATVDSVLFILFVCS
nr:uncharacterized protein LOC103409459 isoform X3 [Malus domestica]